MKKLIKTVAVLMAAALAVGSLASCKMEVDSGAHVRDWGDQKHVKDAKKAYTIELTVEADAKKGVGAVTWYCFAKENGEVIENKYGGFTFGSKNEFKFTKEEITYTNKKGEKVPSKELTLVISSGAKGDKDGKDKDCRGAVKIYADGMTKISSKNFSQKVTPQAIIEITNDEPKYVIGGGAKGKDAQSYFLKVNDSKNDRVWAGDYTVHQLWILLETEPGKYTTNEDLKYTDINIKGSETGVAGASGETKKFLIPSGKSIITTRQENRGTAPASMTQFTKDNNDAYENGNLTIKYWISDIKKKDGKETRTVTYYVTPTETNKKGEVSVVEYKDAKLGWTRDESVNKNPEKPADNLLVARDITKSQVNEKVNNEYWGTLENDIHAHEVTKNSTYTMGNLKLDRFGVSDSFTDKVAVTNEVFTVAGSDSEQK